MKMVTIDFEATGVEPATDRIVQFALARDGHEPLSGLVNPGRPIPPESTLIHKITDAFVVNAMPFNRWAKRIAEYLDGCDAIVGFGCLRFDVPLLAEEMSRAEVPFDWNAFEIIDVGNLFKQMEPRGLSAAVRFYLGRSHDGAHDALADVLATQGVLSAQLDRYEALKGKTLTELAAISRHNGPRLADPHGKLVWIDRRICFNTHRNKGVPVEQEIGYAQWMLRSDFPAATRDVLERELERIEQACYDAEASQPMESPY